MTSKKGAFLLAFLILIALLQTKRKNMKPSGKRLSILTPDEIEEIYGLLKFSHEDRLIYFSFNHAEKEMVSHANFGRLKAKTEVEQQIWNECSRLITNCIIYYNATLLSELLVIKEKEKHFDMVDLLKRISPVAWQHINLRGRYLFRNQKSHGIDLMEIIDSLYDIGIEDTLIKGSLFLN